MRFFYSVLLACFFSLTLFGLIFSDNPGEKVLWGRNPDVKSLRWDTGYGFNELQSLDARVTDENLILEGRQLYKIQTFTKLVFLDSAEICFKPGEADRYMENKGTFRALKTVKIAGENCFSIPAEELQKKANTRHVFEWIRFFFAAFLCSLLFASWISFIWWELFAMRNKVPGSTAFFSLALCTLTGIAFAAWLFHPGYLNPFEPAIILKQIFEPYYSFLIQYFWVSVFELFPFPLPYIFILSLMQLLGFAVALLFIFRKLSVVFPKYPVFFAAIGALLFTPLSLQGHFSLIRSTILGSVNFLFWAMVFLLCAKKRISSNEELIVFVFLAVLAASLRVDNIIFVVAGLCLALWHIPERKGALWGIFAGVFFLGAILVGEMKLKDPWKKDYLARQLTMPVINMNSESPPSQDCIYRNRDVNMTSRAAVLCVKNNLKLYLSSRLNLMRKISAGAVLFFDIKDAYRLPRFRLHLQDLKLLTFASAEEAENSLPYRFSYSFENPVRTLFLIVPLLTIFTVLFFLRSCPATAWVSLLVAARTLFLIAVSPDMGLRYFFEIHLWGMFAPFALYLEFSRHRKINRAPNLGSAKI